MLQHEHHKLVNYVASNWWKTIRSMRMGMDFDDVRQEAFLVCLNAEKSFDPSKGWAFSTYFVTAARHHFSHLITKKIHGEIVTEDVDQQLLVNMIDDGECPETAVSIDQELSASADSLSPIAALIMALLTSPPDLLVRNFEALNSKRELARNAGIDERYPAEMNLTFVCSMLSLMGVSASMINKAKEELKELESRYAV